MVWIVLSEAKLIRSSALAPITDDFMFEDYIAPQKLTGCTSYFKAKRDTLRIASVPIVVLS